LNESAGKNPKSSLTSLGKPSKDLRNTPKQLSLLAITKRNYVVTTYVRGIGIPTSPAGSERNWLGIIDPDSEIIG
jgi:hypothetical protein